MRPAWAVHRGSRIAVAIRRTATRQLLALLCCLPLVACVSVESASRGKPIEARSGQGLVFGRILVVGPDGEVYFPQGSGVASLLSLTPPEPRLNLMGLGPSGGRSWATSPLTVDSDGLFAAWVPAGYYALLTMSPGDNDEQDVDTVALLRVPAEAVAVYTGDLYIEVEITSFGWKDLSVLYEVRGAYVVEGPLSDDQEVLEQRYGPLPSPPAISLWCTGDTRTLDPGNAHNRALLDRGCRAMP